MEDRFWQNKRLSEMTMEEWEALCDGCGRCCLEKLMFEETGRVIYTSVACRHLDIDECRCRIYAKRHKATKYRCVEMSPANIDELSWMPETCAYRRIAEGRDLEPWHPLISGDPESVHDADISVRGKVISARYVSARDLEAYRIDEEL